MARPTVMTPEVIDKLRQAFLIGATNAEAAHYAGIGARTLYDHIEADTEFSQQIEAWRGEPILRAKMTVARALDDDKKVAQWYLERKAADFRPKQEIVDHGLDETRSKLKEFFDDRDDDTPDEPATPDDASAESNAPAEQEATGDVAQSAADIPGV
jgi:Flp pilus assembly protein TadD